MKKQPTPSSQTSSNDEELKQQTAILEKIKFEVGQEMGLNTKEKNKNS